MIQFGFSEYSFACLFQLECALCSSLCFSENFTEFYPFNLPGWLRSLCDQLGNGAWDRDGALCVQSAFDMKVFPDGTVYWESSRVCSCWSDGEYSSCCFPVAANLMSFFAGYCFDVHFLRKDQHHGYFFWRNRWENACERWGEISEHFPSDFMDYFFFFSDSFVRNQIFSYPIYLPLFRYNFINYSRLLYQSDNFQL